MVAEERKYPNPAPQPPPSRSEDRAEIGHAINGDTLVNATQFIDRPDIRLIVNNSGIDLQLWYEPSRRRLILEAAPTLFREHHDKRGAHATKKKNGKVRRPRA